MKSKKFYSSTAWKYFSRYILLYYSLDGKTVQCFTSGKTLTLGTKECCCGHWIKVFDSGTKTNFSTAFEFTNCYPQSSYDNRRLGGRPDIMEQVIKFIYGIDEIYRLKQLAKKPLKIDFDAIAKEYKKKFNELVKVKGNPWK